MYCFTNGEWRQNFKSQCPASLLIGGKEFPAMGKLTEGDKDKQGDTMSAYFKAVPQDREFYGVKCDADGEPIRSQVEQALRSIVIIEFKLR